MRTHFALLVTTLALPLFAGCAVGALLNDAESTDVAEEAITVPENFTYFTARPDYRKCMFPLCGGYWVSRVNRAKTTCVDGTKQEACYVAELDLGGLGLSDDELNDLRSRGGNLLLRGSIEEKDYPSFDGLGVFTTTEAWEGHQGVEATGLFYRVKDNGVRCITYPCASFTEAKLNANRQPRDIAGIDLAAVPADPSDAMEHVVEPDGLMVAGTNNRVSGPGGRMQQLVASEFYVPVRPSNKPQSCGTRGQQEPCPDGMFCNFPPSASCGRTDKPGVCEPVMHDCPDDDAPVCGCDGRDYGNACKAAQHAMSVDFEGPCAPVAAACGGIQGLLCNDDEFCDFPEGQCYMPDAMGTCRTLPESCTAEFAPVCGCDGYTYVNACAAASWGTSVESDGYCY
jgi:Domain of unknown function (DUF6748)/Kazal-type serine protease inhibitor domain